MRYLLTAFSMKVTSDTTLLCSRPHGVEALSDDARLTSVAYIGPKSRTESARKTKIDTEVAHVTRDSDTTFKIKKSKVKVTGGWAYCVDLPHSLFYWCHRRIQQCSRGTGVAYR